MYYGRLISATNSLTLYISKTNFDWDTYHFSDCFLKYIAILITYTIMAKAKTKSKSSSARGLSMQLEEFKNAAHVLRALNHKVRQQILNLIHDKREITVGEIYGKLKMEQSLTSSYLAVLRKANIVKTRREGQSIHYSVNYEHISQVTKGSKIINGQ